MLSVGVSANGRRKGVVAGGRNRTIELIVVRNAGGPEIKPHQKISS